MIEISFTRDDRGRPRVATDEAHRAVADFLEEEVPGPWGYELADKITAAAEHGGDLEEVGNASTLLVSGVRSRIQHHYQAYYAEVASAELAGLIREWVEFLGHSRSDAGKDGDE